MSELDNFIEDFEQGLGDKISELKQPKSKFNRLPKVKITNINPMYTGHIELLDKGIEFSPAYTAFKPQYEIEIVHFHGEPKCSRKTTPFEFLYTNATKVWRMCCDLAQIVQAEYASFIEIRVLGHDGWGKHINCNVTIEYRDDLTVYELADEIITYLWRCKLIE